MWSNPNNTVDGAGGFMDESKSKDADKAKRAQNIFPVMIGHLHKSSGDVMVWGQPARTITIVGILRHMEQSTTKITYEIEDETGRITALRWLEADKQVTEQPLELNTYVRLYGSLREHNEKKHIMAIKVFPVIDLNELTSHLLEVTYIMLNAEKMAIGENASDASAQNKSGESGLTKEHAAILKIIQSKTHTEHGIHRDKLKEQLPKNVLHKVDGIIDFLTSEGHIYTTLTDDYFKTT